MRTAQAIEPPESPARAAATYSAVQITRTRRLTLRLTVAATVPPPKSFLESKGHTKYATTNFDKR